MRLWYNSLLTCVLFPSNCTSNFSSVWLSECSDQDTWSKPLLIKALHLLACLNLYFPSSPLAVILTHPRPQYHCASHSDLSPPHSFNSLHKYLVSAYWAPGTGCWDSAANQADKNPCLLEADSEYGKTGMKQINRKHSMDHMEKDKAKKGNEESWAGGAI